ncbi:MAG: tRNA (adenosine(37)-N6)-threonylcarbamoyltransferase complex dimerization subunit type 1 TsaB [Solobacterium sp.]|nr:tRNA (adenosine(37)-N6)-threonylcarbamoyltransferase complex dimerization subunit type 1 TsaB [Solobacterium sp.]
MITLCMDTSHNLLVLALLEDNRLLGGTQMVCPKKQSEEIFPQLIALMEKTGHKPEEIGAVAVTEGPGSYTGVRIAMTVAKVLAGTRDIPLYTVGTLQLYAGLDDCLVLLDARGGRAYTACCRSGSYVTQPQAVPCEEIRASLKDGQTVYGDGHLIGLEDCVPDLTENFLKLKPYWKKAENVHMVMPEYLKSSDAYLVKK